MLQFSRSVTLPIYDEDDHFVAAANEMPGEGGL